MMYKNIFDFDNKSQIEVLTHMIMDLKNLDVENNDTLRKSLSKKKRKSVLNEEEVSEVNAVIFEVFLKQPEQRSD